MDRHRIGAAERERFVRDGFFVTAPLVDGDTRARARAEIERVWADRCERSARGERGLARDLALVRARPELQRMHLESADLAALCRHPALCEIAGLLIGDDVDLTWNQAHVKAGGADPRTEVPWHQDAAFAELDCPVVLSCWVAVTPATPGHGPLVMGRGTHTEGLRPHRWSDALTYYVCDAPPDQVPVPMEAGQVLVFDARCLHGSGPNREPTTRIGYSISFAPAGARLKINRERFGDQIPVLRAGRRVDDVLATRARSPAGAAEWLAGERLLEELAARLGERTVRERWEAYARALAGGDDASSALTRLLCAPSQEALVNGDLVRSRTDPAAILREYQEQIGHEDPARLRLLLERVLELDPANVEARAELAKLAAPAS